MLDNLLYLTSDFYVPDYYPVGAAHSPRGEASDDLHINVDTPSDSDSPPQINRQPSYGSFSAPVEDPRYDLGPSSSHAHGNKNKIVEAPTMIDYHNAIDVPNLNIIGKPTPPPGYRVKENLPIRRFLAETHRVCIAPALAGIPAFVNNWWKTRRAKRQEAIAREGTKGVGAALQGLVGRTLDLTPGEVLTTRIAGGVFLFLIVALLIYAWLEQKKRNDEVVLDASRQVVERNGVVILVPKRSI